VVVTIGFLLHANFTFSQQATGGSFVRYAVAMAANYPVSILLMFIFVNILHLVVAIASPLSTVILIVWNYTVSRWAILEKARATRGIQNDRG
jgi:putative flippase GtrA